MRKPEKKRIIEPTPLQIRQFSGEEVEGDYTAEVGEPVFIDDEEDKDSMRKEGK